MGKSNEPFWWALFGAGGMIAALFMPITILISSVLVMANVVIPEQDLAPLCQKPLVRIYLFMVISLPLFHWAHRFRFTLVDLGLKALKGPIAVLCYGLAITGTLYAAFLLIWS